MSDSDIEEPTDEDISFLTHEEYMINQFDDLNVANLTIPSDDTKEHKRVASCAP